MGLAVDDPPGSNAGAAGHRVRLVGAEAHEDVERIGVEGQANVGRRWLGSRVRVRVDDPPEDLAGVVGGDRQAEQVVGVDLVAVWRGSLVPRGLEAQGVTAIGRRGVTDDQAARLVRVLGAGVGDDRVADAGGKGRRCRAGMANVAGLGTGGTLMGVSRYLREEKPGVRIVAAEPLPGELVQGLRSLDEGFIPEILDPSLIDAKYLVSNREAIAALRELVFREGIFAGPSCGAVLVAAAREAEAMSNGTIVALLPDGGWKYLSAGTYSTNLDEMEEALEGGVNWW